MKKIILGLVIYGSLAFSSDIPINVEKILNDNNCRSCHNIVGPHKAPPFAGISRRNLRWYGNNAKNVIIKSIKNGSYGKYPPFSDTQMPSFSNLDDNQLEILANWILSLANYTQGYGRGHRWH